ncbi:MAG: hypothetical protein EFT35_01210 [Methanophagales archaeon ANME-1-THS]|nr:MAG: hypothetical protein EFT35_01210 [Methanophagales archaeon ANME-1-THS]
MKKLVAAGIVCLVLICAVLIATRTVLRSNEEPSGLEVVDISIKDPKPSLLNPRSITIAHGESVTLNLTVQNKGSNITRGMVYTVGLEVITSGGNAYWQLPPEQVIGIDLGPGGTSRHTFTVINKKELPFRGACEFQAYIKSVETGEVIARSDTITIEVRYPA